MGLVSAGLFARVKRLQRKHSDTWGEGVIVTWRKWNYNMDRYSEGEGNYSNIGLQALINWNYFRVWGVNDGTEAGEADRQTVTIIFNKDYLESLGYLDAKGNFKFTPSKDRFVIEGTTYIDQGYTPVAQNPLGSLYTMIILGRENVATGVNKFDTDTQPIS